jgi:predicted nuclease with TOPRIM domain
MPRKSTSTTTRQTTNAASVATSDGLAPSDLRLRLEALERDNEKLLKKIEKKRSELNNLIEKIREISVEISQRSAPIFQQLLELDEKIHAVFTEIFNGRKLGQKTRKDIEKVYYMLQVSGLISTKDIDDDDVGSKSNEEDDEWDAEDFFGRQRRSSFDSEPEAPQVDPDELKKIRKIFLKLANVFHPDKMLDDDDREYRTEIMKEINQAYKAGDLAKLLAIEKKHDMGETIDRDNENDLVRRCAQIEQENEVLNSQFANLKEEVRQTKNTQEGAIVTEYKKMTKHGLDPIGEMMAETESQIKIITEMYQFVANFRDRKITVKDFLKGPSFLQQPSPDDLLMELLERIEYF